MTRGRRREEYDYRKAENLRDVEYLNKDPRFPGLTPLLVYPTYTRAFFENDEISPFRGTNMRRMHNIGTHDNPYYVMIETDRELLEVAISKMAQDVRNVIQAVEEFISEFLGAGYEDAVEEMKDLESYSTLLANNQAAEKTKKWGEKYDVEDELELVMKSRGNTSIARKINKDIGNLYMRHYKVHHIWREIHEMADFILREIWGKHEQMRYAMDEYATIRYNTIKKNRREYQERQYRFGYDLDY